MQCWWYKKHQSNHWTDIWPDWQSINSSLKWTCMNFVFTSLVDNVLWSFLLYFMDTIYDWQIILWHLVSTLYCGRWNKYNFVIYDAEQNCYIHIETWYWLHRNWQMQVLRSSKMIVCICFISLDSVLIEQISQNCVTLSWYIYLTYTSYTTYLVVKYTTINCGSDDTKSPDFIADRAEFISTHRIIVLACDDWWPRIFLINNFD